MPFQSRLSGLLPLRPTSQSSSIILRLVVLNPTAADALDEKLSMPLTFEGVIAFEVATEARLVRAALTEPAAAAMTEASDIFFMVCTLESVSRSLPSFKEGVRYDGMG